MYLWPINLQQKRQNIQWMKDSLFNKWWGKNWTDICKIMKIVKSLTPCKKIKCTKISCRMPGSAVLHYLLEFAQTHVRWVHDAIQTSTPNLNLSQYQGLFQWVSSSHQVPKMLVLQLDHQSFQWIFKVDFF